MAFDTAGKNERELVPEGELYNPLISPDGRRVIYSAKTDGKLRIHGVDWNGANSRILGDVAIWKDETDGSVYVIYNTNPKSGEVLFFGSGINNVPVFRITGWDGWARQAGTVEIKP